MEEPMTRIDITYSSVNCFMQALAYLILAGGGVFLTIYNSPWWMAIVPFMIFKAFIKTKLYLFLKYSSGILDEILNLLEELDWEGNEDEIEGILTQATGKIKLESSDLKEVMKKLKSDLSQFKRSNNE